MTVVKVTQVGTGLVDAFSCTGAKENSKKAAVIQRSDFFIAIIYCEKDFNGTKVRSLK